MAAAERQTELGDRYLRAVDFAFSKVAPAKAAFALISNLDHLLFLQGAGSEENREYNPVDGTLAQGSKILAEEWLIDHPFSIEARNIAEMGLARPAWEHLSLYLQIQTPKSP